VKSANHVVMAKQASKSKAKPAAKAKPAVKAKPALKAKPAAKALAKPTAKPAVKVEAKKPAKLVEKAPAKPAAKPVVAKIEKVKAPVAAKPAKPAKIGKAGKSAKSNKSSEDDLLPEEGASTEDLDALDEFDEDLSVTELSEDSDEDDEDEELAASVDPDEVILTDAEGRRYCKVRECDQISSVEAYCRFHYLLLWKRIQVRRKILADGKFEKYVEDLTSRYPDKFLEMIAKDLRAEKDFVAAIAELEIDESAIDGDFEDESQNFIEEVRGVTSETASIPDDDEF
jgi:hypothetical protein